MTTLGLGPVKFDDIFLRVDECIGRWSKEREKLAHQVGIAYDSLTHSLTHALAR